jgi:hypothetical protein
MIEAVADELAIAPADLAERLRTHLAPALDRLDEIKDDAIEEITDHDFDGVPVAAFRLPISARAFGLINDVAEAIYGAGDYDMRMHGSQVSIIAPKGGRLRRIRRGLFADAAIEVDGDGLVTSANLDGEGNVKLAWELPAEMVQRIAASMGMWFESVGGINYVEQRLHTRGEDGDEAEWVFTLQLARGVTPHMARQIAEAHAVALAEQLRALGVEPVDAPTPESLAV